MTTIGRTVTRTGPAAINATWTFTPQNEQVDVGSAAQGKSRLRSGLLRHMQT